MTTRRPAVQPQAPSGSKPPLDTLPTELALVTASIAIALFTLITLLVQMRLLTGADLAFTLAAQQLAGPLLDAAATVTGIAAASQMSILYCLVACLLLWCAGLGIWSLAPATFLLGTVLEVVMKLTIQQPTVPEQFHRSAYYPFLSVDLNGSFPSGHALRTAFFCTFVAVLLWSHGSRRWRLAAVAVGMLQLPVGFTRVYVGDHWLTDVVAGLLIGSALALLSAPPVARRLAPRS